LCGKNAKAFKFSELSILLKEKLSSKKAIERNNKIKRIIDRILLDFLIYGRSGTVKNAATEEHLSLKTASWEQN